MNRSNKRTKDGSRTNRINHINDYFQAYWLDEPDELYVRVDLTFLNANGEYQQKSIRWFNPEYEVIREQQQEGLETITLEELMKRPYKPAEERIPYLKEIKAGKIRRKKKQ